MHMPVQSIGCWGEVRAMPEHSTIQSYLETVASQIRWKRARPVVTLELERHLEDQRDAFAAEGHENAEQMALDEMGDPVKLGVELDSIHRPAPQYGLLALTILFAFAGAMLRIWLTADWKQYNMDIDPRITLLAFGIGCAALLLGYFLDYARLGVHGRKVYAGALLVGVVMLITSPHSNGVAYYAGYLTLCYPVVYAFWLYTCRRKGWMGLMLSIIGGIPLAVICVLVPNTFGLLMLLTTGVILLIAAAWNDWFALGRRKSLLSVLLCAAIIAGIIFGCLISSGSGLRRWDIALHPEQDPLGAGYQAYTIRQTLGVSQWIGEGTWSSEISARPFERTVPACGGDGLLTTLIYKMGWLPFLIVVAAFMALAGWLVYRCLKHKSQLGKVVVLAVVITLFMQALCSVAWNLGFTLFSAAFPMVVGNLNTVIDMWLIGLALSVFRGEHIARDQMCDGKSSLPHYRIEIHIQKC